MKFFGAVLLVSAYAVVCNGGYPKITAIFADPHVYTRTFTSGRYDLNEQFSFNRNISLDAVIAPTRVKDAGSNAPYEETYNVIVEAADDLGDYGYREDVGVGYYKGTVEPGSTVVVPIRSMRDPEGSLVAVPARNGAVLRYVIYLQYGMMPLQSYPEFTNRSLEFLDIFSRTPSPFGPIVGLQYSLP